MDEVTLKNFLKGKITEFIVAEMFKEGMNEVVIHLGYEYTTPELAEYHSHPMVMKALKNLRTAPDLVLIPKNNSSAFLVEVKYTSDFTRFDIKKAVLETSSFWDNVHLLVATNDRFYYGDCEKILLNDFKISPLDIISPEIQSKYLKILNEFILRIN
jgi:hypothetical protein